MNARANDVPPLVQVAEAGNVDLLNQLLTDDARADLPAGCYRIPAFDKFELLLFWNDPAICRMALASLNPWQRTMVSTFVSSLLFAGFFAFGSLLGHPAVMISFAMAVSLGVSFVEGVKAEFVKPVTPELSGPGAQQAARHTYFR